MNWAEREYTFQFPEFTEYGEYGQGLVKLSLHVQEVLPFSPENQIVCKAFCLYLYVVSEVIYVDKEYE